MSNNFFSESRAVYDTKYSKNKVQPDKPQMTI
jgi:hypothetical protein